MAAIGEVYGQNFKEVSHFEKAKYGAKNYGKNIANRQFSFRQNTFEMWNGDNMTTDSITILCETVQTLNKNMRIIHINKQDHRRLSALPFLINGPVEYFVVIDLEPKYKTQVYTLYITPTKMEAF
jgi:hypothetical protein